MTRPRTLRPCLPALALALAALAGSAGCASSAPAEADGVFKQGLEQAEAGNLEAALETLQKGARQWPEHVRMRFELARLQYESGEAYHVRERKAMRNAAVFLEQGKKEEALANRRRANQERAKATPFYQAARENLAYVEDEADEDHLIAWANFMLMRVAVFFEDWEAADEHLDRAIELGKPTGPLLAQWREFQAGIRDKLRRPARH